MPTTTLTSREFHQDSGKVKRAAQNGPVIITDRGKPVLVVQRFEDFRAAAVETAPPRFVSLYDVFSKPHPAADIDFDIPEIREYPKETDFS